MNNSKEQVLLRGGKVMLRAPAQEIRDRGTGTLKESPTQGDPQLSRRTSRAAQVNPKNNGAISLKGLLAAQRFTKGLKERTVLKIAAKRSPGLHLQKPVAIVDDMVPSTSSRPQEKFSCAKVQQLVKSFLASRLEGVSYEAGPCTGLAQELSEEVRGLVRAACPRRYKLVCVVTVGKKAREDAVVASRCLWDPHSDSFASCTYENPTLFCVVTVFAVYCE